MDAEVATKIMRLCAYRRWPDADYDSWYVVPTTAGTVPSWDEVEMPAYSTDIGAAFQIVEHMRSSGYIDIVITTGADDALWTVGIHKRSADWHLAWGDTSKDDRSKAPVAHDASLPLAICRAALKAVSA